MGLEVLKKSIGAALAVLLPNIAAARGEPLLMLSRWAKLACDAWNAEPALTGELVSSGWVKNRVNRGFKVIHVFRTSAPIAGQPPAPRHKRECLRDQKASLRARHTAIRFVDQNVRLLSGAALPSWSEIP